MISIVGRAGLALADAFDLRGVQRVELVLVAALLGADALGALQPQRQVRAALGWLGWLGGCAGAPPAATVALSAASLRCTSRITVPRIVR